MTLGKSNDGKFYFEIKLYFFRLLFSFDRKKFSFIRIFNHNNMKKLALQLLPAYKKILLADCEETAYIVLPAYVPLNLDSACQYGSFHYKHFEEKFNLHFAYLSYKTLVETGSVPDLTTSYKNGSLCRDYVQKVWWTFQTWTFQPQL